MQDGKALQAGTSHHLGQNFAKAFDVTFQTEKGTREHVHATSWGVSTRLIGAVIMAHADDRGLILPPRLAETQVVIVPIFKKPEELAKLIQALDAVKAGWEGHFTWLVDDRNTVSPGYKFADWELKGIPLRIEIGPRDLEKGQVVVARRDKERGEEGQKTFIKLEDLAVEIPRLLEAVQTNLYERALAFRRDHSYEISSYDEMKAQIDEKPGFYYAFFAENEEAEAKIKEETSATVRCIPFEGQGQTGKCFYSGLETSRRVIFARAY